MANPVSANNFPSWRASAYARLASPGSELPKIVTTFISVNLRPMPKACQGQSDLEKQASN
jgi:hypothetical protein